MPFKYRLPGYLATGFLILTTSLWTFWGIAELYYEGWGLPFPAPLAYLIPAAICLVFTLLALRWPRVGGWTLIVCGTAFTIWWWNMAAQRAGGLSMTGVLSMFPVSALLIVTGVLFLLEGRFRRRRQEAGWQPSSPGWRRKLGYLLALGIPLLVIIIVSVVQLPPILSRHDDGLRGARLIEGDGVILIWAPEGPGWNWRQPWGGYPAWHSLALYGQSPLGLEADNWDLAPTAFDMEQTGLCASLTADGLSLADAPLYIWRMPTVDELVASLTRDGVNAGCRWNGQEGEQACAITPDKETPLWNPGAPPIYYWAAEEYDERDAYYVSYNGYVGAQPKTFGNPRHGYRCVREP
ncbi:MAG: hypothetical protein JXB85_13540 [Anaerolineales bacterium]|nr:hypothetical protein [Anaerolineales bacterium]